MDNSTELLKVQEAAERRASMLAELRATPPIWFTVDQVAVWLNIRKTSADLLIRRGDLESNRFGGNRRVSYDVLREYEKQTVTPAAAAAS